MPTDYHILFCTCPDQNSAENIATLLVTSQLAACVNVIPGVTSFYTWNNQLESAHEHLLLIKAQKNQYPALEAAIKQHHPYEIPEIIALGLDQGLPAYLNWITSCHSIA